MYQKVEHQSLTASSLSEYGVVNHRDPYQTTLVPNRSSPTFTAPSMRYPTLLKPGDNFGYDALTHDSDASGYYTIQSAYGKTCEPQYYVGTCPSNHFHSPFPPSSSSSSPSFPLRESFQLPSIENDLKESGNLAPVIYMYVSTNCEPSMRALTEYKEHPLFQSMFHLFNIDVDPMYKESIKDLGGFATPFFYDPLHKKSVTGYFPLHDLLHQLCSSSSSSAASVKEGFSDRTASVSKSKHVLLSLPSDLESKLKELKIRVFTTNCPYCDKLKKLLEPYKKYVTYVDRRDPETKKKRIRAFPTLYSDKTKKFFIGFNADLPKIIHDLS